MVCSPGHPTEILRRQVPNGPGRVPRHASSACAFTHGSAFPGWCTAAAYLTSFFPTVPR